MPRINSLHVYMYFTLFLDVLKPLFFKGWFNRELHIKLFWGRGDIAPNVRAIKFIDEKRAYKRGRETDEETLLWHRWH